MIKSLDSIKLCLILRCEIKTSSFHWPLLAFMQSSKCIGRWQGYKEGNQTEQGSVPFHSKESQILLFLLLFTTCFFLQCVYSGARKMFFKCDLREYLTKRSLIECGYWMVFVRFVLIIIFGYVNEQELRRLELVSCYHPGTSNPTA